MDIQKIKDECIRRAAIAFRDTWFDMIPSVMFEKHKAVENGEYDEVLCQLNGNRICPSCESDDITYTNEDGQDSDEEPLDIYEWTCNNCNEYGDTINSLMFEPLNGWPCAHGIMFWTTQRSSDSHEFIKAADNAGFIVFEPQDFDGLVLGIDGGGYSFTDEHWIPLYKNLGFTWHEQDPEWPEISDDDLKSQKLSVYVGPTNVQQYMQLFKTIFPSYTMYDGTEHIYICNLNKIDAVHMINQQQNSCMEMLRLIQSAHSIARTES